MSDEKPPPIDNIDGPEQMASARRAAILHMIYDICDLPDADFWAAYKVITQ